jgi:large conductance mechanosensitive channel
MNMNVGGAKNLMNEFFDFLKNFGVVGLAIGVVVGGAVKEYVDQLVKELITPIVNRVLELIKFQAGGTIGLGGTSPETTSIQVGAFIGSTINFLVLMVIVFIAVKFFINKFMHEADKKNTGV